MNILMPRGTEAGPGHDARGTEARGLEKPRGQTLPALVVRKRTAKRLCQVCTKGCAPQAW